MLKTKYADAKKDIHGAICITKNIWVNNVTESVHSVKFSPKEVQKAIEILKQGHVSHHKKKECMKFYK